MKTRLRKIPKYEDKVLSKEDKIELKRQAWLKAKNLEGGKKQDDK
jgi:hypothetical protein